MAWIFGLAALMLLDSDTVLNAVNGAAGVFVRSVMPALFPMMVLNGLSARLSGREKRWMTVGFCWLAGSPASAQRLEGLRERGELPERALLPLAAATGVMSPLFFVGSLGSRLPNPAGGWLLLTAHWLGALAAAGLIHRLSRRFSSMEKAETVRPEQRTATGRTSLLAALPDSLRQAGTALLSVCGAMMLFSILAAFFRQGLSALLPGWAADHPEIPALLWALLEIGGGAHALLDVSPTPDLPLLCALCSFGGLSIWMQNLLFLGKSIRPGKLLLLRLLHGAAAYGVCRMLVRLFPFFL
ncbi:MAG: hypothetical protein SO010_04505 [Candidatus Limiplasma sp.]|nr:hypothetical protein [Candidatus Limiplasma sp.]